MRIVLIGAGNLATHLAKALIKAKHDIVQVFSRTEESAEALAKIAECESTTDIYNIRCDADIYIFSVKDSVLERLANCVAENVHGKLFVHTAGSMPMDILPVERRGVLYPMQTFSKSREVDFSVIPTFIEAEKEEDLNTLQELASSITTSVRVLSSNDRKSLHVAAVFACNFVNHCYRLSEKVLADYGVPFSVMLPLVDETARKVHEISPKDAQTGPAVRWDENVMLRHKQMLENDAMMKEIYELMSKSIHNDKL